jgi:hypothetical protein
MAYPVRLCNSLLLIQKKNELFSPTVWIKIPVSESNAFCHLVPQQDYIRAPILLPRVDLQNIFFNPFLFPFSFPYPYPYPFLVLFPLPFPFPYPTHTRTCTRTHTRSLICTCIHACVRTRTCSRNNYSTSFSANESSSKLHLC